MLLNKLTTMTAIAAVCLIISPVVGQTGENTQTSIMEAGSTTMLSVDGRLSGSVATGNSQVPNAKVSLVSQGKVIDSVTADESGSFSFANVNPGPYQIVGSADGMVGSSALNVAAFADTGAAAPATVMLQASSAQTVYDSYGSTPVSAFSTNPVASYNTGCGCSACSSAPVSSCNTCGGGGIGSRLGGNLGGGNFGGGLGGGNFGGGLGGRLGGGLLTSPRGLLLIGGLAGGLASIEDSSPDQ